MSALPVSAKSKIIAQATAVFVSHGYDKLTMGKIAEILGVTRRALYHHFRSKEELFRACIKLGNVAALEKAMIVARDVTAKGAAPLDVITEWCDARFGQTRRTVNNSPHGAALNELAFRLATDLMIEVSYDSNRAIGELLAELQTRGKLELRPGCSIERAARMIGDGARGVNQARPPIPNGELNNRYREMAEAVLYGCALPPKK